MRLNSVPPQLHQAVPSPGPSASYEIPLMSLSQTFLSIRPFMKSFLWHCVVLSVSLASGAQLLAAEEAQPTTADTAAPPPSAPAQLSAAELEKLVMPIALHPDPLIAIVLPASVYPLEIVQAARFVKDTNNIPKVDDQPWDDNVKAVAKVPDMIAKMDADLPWTVALGQAFLDQPKELMDTIQDLRTKAAKAGTLQTTPQQIVTVTNVVVLQTNVTEVVSVTKEVVQVVPSNPEVIYVPTYPPTVYYPPPGYVYSPYAPLVTFGVGMACGAILANNCNWGHGEVDVDVNKNVNRNTNVDRNRSQTGNRASNTGAKSGSQKWQPNQSRMQQSGAKVSASTQNARGWGSSGSKPTTGNVAARPSTGSAGTRPSASTASSRPSGGASGASARPTTSQSSRSSSPSASSRSSSGGSAFSGAGSGSGSSARSSSSRGSSSRSGGGGRSAGSRGGGGRR